MISDPRLGTVDLKAKDELIKIHSKVHYLEENVQNFMLKHVYSSFKINLSGITANYDTILHQAAEASCSAAFHQGQVTNI